MAADTSHDGRLASPLDSQQSIDEPPPLTDDYFDLFIDSISSSTSPMSTSIFDAEPNRLSWDSSAFGGDPLAFSPFSANGGPFLKEEPYEKLDLSAIPLDGFTNSCLFDTGDGTGYVASRAPFDGLIDFDADCSPRKFSSSTASSNQHHQDPSSSLHKTPLMSTRRLGDTLSGTPATELSPSSDRSPFYGSSVSRKRKSCDSNVSAPPSSRSSVSPPPSPVHKKASHNMIEKRYRTNLNDKILALRDAVPSLSAMAHQTADGAGQQGSGGGNDDDDGSASAQKLSKATILSKATEYIRHMERKNDKLGWENVELRNRVARLENMVLNSVNAFADAESHRFPT